MSKFWASLFFIIILTWFSFFTAFNRDYTIRLKDVDKTVYKYTQIAGKKGMLSKYQFDQMMNQLGRNGTFDIYLVAEKFDRNALVQKTEGYSLIDMDLRANGYDLITITVIGQQEHPLSAIHSLTIFGTQGENRDYRLVGNACAFIE